MARQDLVVALGESHYRIDGSFYVHSASGLVSDVAVDPSSHVHVLLRFDPRISSDEDTVVTLDADGQVVARWGRGILVDAHMLTAAPDGRLFVVDRDAHEVVIFTDRRRTGGLGSRHQPLHPFNHPTAVAFCPRGSVYVSDGYANHKVHRFSPEGQLLASWGEYGGGPGQFINPHAVWVQPDGRVVVVDRENHRLQVFTPDGTLIDIRDGFVSPLGIWGDEAGRLYVTDRCPTVTLMSPEAERLARCRPVLDGAHGISGDRNGVLYLAEPSHNRVTRLVPL